VRSIAADRIEEAAEEHSRGGIVRGLVRLDDEMVILLDVQTIVRQVLL
jgi:chemotaxis signal transduction protein